eukprot:scaffold15423_cov70-Phaeocystis_antarctica.AAC.7
MAGALQPIALLLAVSTPHHADRDRLPLGRSAANAGPLVTKGQLQLRRILASVLVPHLHPRADYRQRRLPQPLPLGPCPCLLAALARTEESQPLPQLHDLCVALRLCEAIVRLAIQRCLPQLHKVARRAVGGDVGVHRHAVLGASADHTECTHARLCPRGLPCLLHRATARDARERAKLVHHDDALAVQLEINGTDALKADDAPPGTREEVFLRRGSRRLAVAVVDKAHALQRLYHLGPSERGRQVVGMRLARRDEEHGHVGVDSEHLLEPLDQLARLLRRAARLD